MRTKRFVSICVATLLLLCTLPVAYAAQPHSGECGDDAFYTLDADGTLTISGTGAMTSYTKEGESDWSFFDQEIKQLVISEGITEIGDYSFNGCPNMTKVTFPSTLETIGAFSFSNNTGIQSVTIPDTVKTIEIGAFSNATNLETVSIGSGITSLNSKIFSNCTGLKEIFIPETVQTMGDEVFFHCSAMKKIAIENGLRSVGYQCFAKCSSLKSIVFPATFTTMGRRIVYQCDALEQVTFLCYNPGILDYEDSFTNQIRIYGHRMKNGEVTRIATLSEKYGWQFVALPEFEDVLKADWFDPFVYYAACRGWYHGTSPTLFSPNLSMTREMLALVLYRMADEPAVDFQPAFVDVDEASIYAKACVWANEQELMTGTDVGNFSPKSPVIRQDFALILYRMNGTPDNGTIDVLEPFADCSAVSAYAKDAMSWAVAQGMISGDDNMLNPRTTATRAEIATILVRCEQRNFLSVQSGVIS